MNDSNHIILLTGPGISALATIRLSGRLVPAFLRDHFSRTPVPGAIVHGQLRDETGVIDDPVVVLAEDGATVDLTLHGGSWVVQSAIEAALRAGFSRVIFDGSSPAPLVRSGNPFDVEYQYSLQRIRTERAARTMLAQPLAWRQWVTSSPDVDSIRAVLADHSLHYLLHPPSVAIIGLPNAGKSTLANQLFGVQRSIVSPIAGTTRDWVGEEANLDGLIATLLDTPGRHDTADPIERHAIDQSDLPIADASLVIVLLDATRPLADQQHLTVAYDRPLIAVNKVDDCSPHWSDETIRQLKGVRLIAREAVGVDLLIGAILAHFQIGSRPTSSPRCWTARQRHILQHSIDYACDISAIFDSREDSRLPGRFD